MIQDSSKQGLENIVIVGDFNMPDIDWESWNGRSESDILFIEALQDQFMHQHVDERPRFRFGQMPSLHITYLQPLAKSDYLCLRFNINPEPETSNNSQQRYGLDKGDNTRLEHII